MQHSSETLNSNSFPSSSDKRKQQSDRDRAVRPRRAKSRGRYAAIKNTTLWKIKFAKCLVDDLKNYGPAGLLHMEAVSNVIGRPIKIWKSDGRVYRTVNNGRSNENVNVQYHQRRPESIGHWTLPGNRDPGNVETDLNACLFTVIASQTGRSATKLRASTVNYLTNNLTALTDIIDEFLPSNGKEGTPLMIGGAWYTGTSPHAAQIVLDNSQNVLCYGCRDYGHPRGHASHDRATGPKDSVENYSRTTGEMKSGFLSRSDQDHVAHFALRHALAQSAMRSLNAGAQSQAVTLMARDLEGTGCVLPKMKEWYSGQEYSGELDIIRLTLVLRHHDGKYNDANADVFVHTFYPRRY
ncbi:uncharacterized protein LOC143366391 [Andrena cerasifolii]|uniref:uncharacterized protein LOC143366391 n=1 Tax=Andrena cerasifolii TaxID=2819439 RepID=UPI004037EF31